MSGTAHVLCADGSVIEHALPLPEGIADRVARDELRLANADGSSLVEAAEQPAPRARKATKAPTEE